MSIPRVISALVLGALCSAMALAQMPAQVPTQDAPRVSAPAAPAPAPVAVGFSIVKTAQVPVREGLLFAGGRFTRALHSHFSAFLVRHGDTQFLFDTGLGARVAAQYQQDMPTWSRPFFRYEDPVRPARAQLAAAGIGPITRIILSHGHWDHASGIEDFPGAQVWAAAPELAWLRTPSGGVGGAWASQVGDPAIRWQALPLRDQPHEGFEQSLDLFGDGRVVLVAMAGHTPGSVGLFLTVSSGTRYFFVGDVVWSAAALREGRPKFWPARVLVDAHAEATAATIEKIRAVMARDPSLVVVPAHDGAAQDALGYLPKWIE